MHADVTEILSEARLHKGAGPRIKWLTWRTQNVIDYRRNHAHWRTVHRGALQDGSLSLLSAGIALTSRRRALSAGALALKQAATDRREGWYFGSS